MDHKKIIDLLEEIAPTEWFEDKDNSGIQIESKKKNIRRVMVCLEINDDIIDEAINKKIDMIITHHPLLFTPISSITSDSPVGNYVIRCIRAGIGVYSSHLAFDTAIKGNNMYLAELLKLEDVAAPIEEQISCDGYEYDPDEVGSIGYLPRTMTFKQLCKYVEICLDLPKHYISCVDGGNDKIKKIAFCTGAGGEFIYTAVRENCDAYITGDLKLHEAQFAKAKGLTVIDAGHYGTEKIFTENMASLLRNAAKEARYTIEVIEAESNTNPYIL